MLFFIATLFISRLGLVKLASGLFIFAFLIGVTYTGFKWGINLPIALLSYALIIAISSMIGGALFGFSIAAIVSVLIIVIGYLQLKSIVQPLLYWKSQPLTLGNVIEYSAILFVIMVVAWLSNREIAKSLNRAKQSEAELKEERDLLEVKVIQRTEQVKRMQLEKMSNFYHFAEIGKVASGLFHDLINPLSAVVLSVERLKGLDVKGKREAQDSVKRAMEVTKRMGNLMLVVKKQIKYQEILTNFSLNDEIYHVIQILRFKANQNNVAVSFEEGPPIRTYGNPLKFHQVVANLIANAIDAYTHIDQDRIRKVVISLATVDNSVILEANDFGSGIAPEDAPKIFDPFFSTKASEEGVGIGLSTVKEIVEKDFNGEISFKSEPGLGTIFRVIFPLTKKHGYRGQNQQAD